MISAPSTWLGYNANLAKDPVLTLEIDGYPRLLSTKKVNGIYNTTNYKLPFPTPVGQYLMWATPTVAEFGDDSGAGGSNPTYGTVSGLSASGALINRVHSGPVGDASTWARWRGFAMPTLPAGAVIQSIIGVFEASLYGTGHFMHGAAASNGLLNPAPPSTGGHGFNGPNTVQAVEDNPYPTFYTTSFGTTSTDVTSASMYGRFYETAPETASENLSIKDPRIAIYFTLPGGSLIGDPWIKIIDGLSYDASPLDGSSSLGDVTVTVLDWQRLLTADMAAYVLEGRTCRIKTGFVGLDYADYVTLFTGQVDTIPSSDNDLSYDFTLKNALLELKQLIFQTGDDGQPTDSDHPKTIVGNPMEILKSILLDYLSMDPGKVDTAKIDAYGNGDFAGVQFEFHQTSPPEAKAFIEQQIMKPLGGYLRSTNEGVITPQFFSLLPGVGASVKSLTNANMTGIPEANQADLVNVVTFRFDKVDDKYTSEIPVKDVESVAKYGPVGTQVIESDGMRSGFQGYFLAKLTANSIFGRFGDKNPTFDMECFWDCALLEQGDVVDVTHALMPDRKAGTMGVTAALFEVQTIEYDLEAFTVTLTLVDASFAAALGHWKVAPDSVPDWTLASTVEQDKYMFVSDATGQMSDSTDGHTLE